MKIKYFADERRGGGGDVRASGEKICAFFRVRLLTQTIAILIADNMVSRWIFHR